MGLLDGKVVAITGATSGIGLGVATRFADEAASVCLLARDVDRLDHVAAAIDGDTVALPTDVGDPASVERTFAAIGERFGRLDVLVNAAAIYRPCPVEKLTDLDIQAPIATNLMGPIHTCRAAIPLMRLAGGGDIVNTSSESTLHPFPMLSIYVATKAALETFGTVLADEVGDDGIRVTTVVQGTAIGAGGGSTGWEWDPDQLNEALALWSERGLLQTARGHLGGQGVADAADTYLYVVTRPRTQKIDRIHVRSF